MFEVIHHVLLGGDRHAITGGRMKAPAFERGQNLAVNGRSHTPHNRFADDGSAFVNRDLNHHVPFSNSQQIFRIDSGLGRNRRQSRTYLFAPAAPSESEPYGDPAVGDGAAAVSVRPTSSDLESSRECWAFCQTNRFLATASLAFAVRAELPEAQ